MWVCVCVCVRGVGVGGVVIKRFSCLPPNPDARPLGNMKPRWSTVPEGARSWRSYPKKGDCMNSLNVAQQPGFILNSSVQQPLASILWENYFLIVSYLLMTPAMWITHAVESRHCAHVLGASFQSSTLQEMQQQRHKLNPTQRRTIFRTH